MVKKENPQTSLLNLFSQEKCWKIDGLSHNLNYSIISVRRFLKGIGYYSSYTHNSGWYTLETIPSFNKRGVWFYQNIGFSKHGNLNKTILYFIEKSRQGLTAKELLDFLLIPCHSVLNLMYKKGQIDRTNSKMGFVYLSNDERIKQQQLGRIKAWLIEEKKPQHLQPQAAIYVLVEYIKQPNASFVELSRSVKKKREMIVPPEAITRFFEEHDLKKTPQ
jgi:hypothetical protein